jgi:hypothetical protein
MAETLAFAKSLRLRLCGADRLRDQRETYSRCRLIKTSEASMTPIASIPTAICPSAIESSVQAKVVDPINSGMGQPWKIGRGEMTWIDSRRMTVVTSGVVTG